MLKCTHYLLKLKKAKLKCNPFTLQIMYLILMIWCIIKGLNYDKIKYKPIRNDCNVVFTGCNSVLTEFNVVIGEFNVVFGDFNVEFGKFNVEFDDISVVFADYSVVVTSYSVVVIEDSVVVTSCSVVLAECSVAPASCSFIGILNEFVWNIGFVMTPRSFNIMLFWRIFLTVACLIVIIYVLNLPRYIAKI